MDNIERLKNMDDNKLIDIVKNYRQYGFDNELRMAAIKILEERGIDKTILELTGNFENKTYDYARELYTSYDQNSKIAFFLYVLLLITFIGDMIDGNNYPKIGLIILIFECGLLIAYLVFFIKSYLNLNQFFKITNSPHDSERTIMFFTAGSALYLLMYFYYKNLMKERMKLIT